MARRIYDEAELTNLVLVAWHEKATLFRMGGTHAANRGDDFGHPGMVVRAQRGDDDPVAGMRPLKSAAILFMGFAMPQEDV
ncbi:hypothetical protein GGD56_006822 [Rhizobium mongolense]|uniref:Uncharacterized protein n=1 Tax=Rhizobium mongolense TaxID=57676 RepID=A0ABR6IZG7_9HYPH|nr:hypothetical protein [Rhizobium mongolense]